MMQNQGYYPSNLSYIVRKISGYSRRTIRIQPISANSAITPGSIINVDLPSNSICDIGTLNMVFGGRSFGTSAAAHTRMPPNVETLIERCNLEINGQSIGGDCSNLNQLYMVLSDLQNSATANHRRNILNGNNSTLTIPNSVDAERTYVVSTFLGFLNSGFSYCDTSLLGNVRIRIVLANPGVVSCSAAATGISYLLNNLYFTMDVVGIDDGIYYNLHQTFLAKGGTYQIPFKNYLNFTNSSSSIGQSTNFSVSSQSVDRLISFHTLGLSGDAAAQFDATTHRSKYFTRIGKGSFGDTVMNFDNYIYTIGSENHPSFSVPPELAFSFVDNSFGNRSSCVVSGINPNIVDNATFMSNFFVVSTKLNHGSDGVPGEISGIDSRGASLMLSYTTQGSTGAGVAVPNVITHTFVECTALLVIGAGRQIQVIN
jgi:hypothetical protein